MDVNIPPAQRDVYTRAMVSLNEAGIPYLVSGALAVHHYTGLWRHTKDLDLFLCPDDRDAALLVLANAGYRVEITAGHWLAKAFMDDVLVDLISGTGNWLAPVDTSWFDHAEPSEILGIPCRVIGVVELIWAKSYVAGRERFDGADIAHLIRRSRERIDWELLMSRFNGHWELLLLYLNYFRFVYPEHRDAIPDWVVEDLAGRLLADARQPAPPEVAFRGPLLDRYAYLVDLDEWGEPDPRVEIARERNRPASEVAIQRAADQRRMAEKRVQPSTP
ncbi:MAG TPA: nucleotidyltransferase [Thermomicrobiaceae bacterium]|nr:nucleotidyltransferase [Thermomicrobiaceae bacterium]